MKTGLFGAVILLTWLLLVGLLPLPTLCLVTADYFIPTSATPTMTWMEASDLCKTNGVRMITINDATVMQELSSAHAVDLSTTNPTFIGDMEFWIGASDFLSSGVYRWEDTSPLTYAPWRDGHPSTGGRADCLRYTNSSITDTACSYELGVVCEKTQQGESFPPCQSGCIEPSMFDWSEKEGKVSPYDEDFSITSLEDCKMLCIRKYIRCTTIQFTGTSCRYGEQSFTFGSNTLYTISPREMNCYHVDAPADVGNVTFDNAEDMCNAEGLQLARTSTYVDLDRLKSIAFVKGIPRFWVGLHDRDSNGVFQFSNDSSSEYPIMMNRWTYFVASSWRSGMPYPLDHSPYPQCVAYTVNSGLEQVDCTESLPFFCSQPMATMNISTTCQAAMDQLKQVQNASVDFKLNGAGLVRRINVSCAVGYYNYQLNKTSAEYDCGCYTNITDFWECIPENIPTSPGDMTTQGMTSQPEEMITPRMTSQPEDITTQRMTSQPEEMTTPRMTSQPEKMTTPTMTTQPEDMTTPRMTTQSEDMSTPRMSSHPDTQITISKDSAMTEATTTSAEARTTEKPSVSRKVSCDLSNMTAENRPQWCAKSPDAACYALSTRRIQMELEAPDPAALIATVENQACCLTACLLCSCATAQYYRGTGICYVWGNHQGNPIRWTVIG